VRDEQTILYLDDLFLSDKKMDTVNSQILNDGPPRTLIDPPIVSKDARHHMLVNRAALREIAKSGRLEFNDSIHSSKQPVQKVHFNGQSPECKGIRSDTSLFNKMSVDANATVQQPARNSNTENERP
jgi:hypothetical protein